MGIDAIVTDVHARGPLAGLRGLGRAGLRVVALGPCARAAGRWSRYAEASATGPDSAHGEAFARRVSELCAAHRPAFVYPGQEEAIDALLERGSSDGVPLPYPGGDPLRRLRDKRDLPELGAAAGLQVPATLMQIAAGELADAAPGLPLVVKPARSGGALTMTLIIETREELDALVAKLPATEALFMQERVSGPLAAVVLVVDSEGTTRALFQQVASRTWPLDAGVSTRAESVAPDVELVGACARLLSAAGYWGLAQLQFVSTRRGLALVDVNPRFYGSLPLALAAGVNLPATWHAVAVGDDPGEPVPYRTGLTYRWLEGDLLAFARERRIEALRPARQPRVPAVWAWDDPLPGFLLAGEAVASRVRRRTRRLLAGAEATSALSR
jgi:predicted ATP-grasp superfamily ATP-dependent carboligase